MPPVQLLGYGLGAGHALPRPPRLAAPENALAKAGLNWFSDPPVARMVELADTIL